MAQNTVAPSKVVVMASSAYDFMDESNYRIGTHLGNNSYKINTFNPLTGVDAVASGDNIKFSQLFSDGFVSSTPKLRSKINVVISVGDTTAKTQTQLLNGLNGKVGLQSLPHSRMLSTSSVKLNGSASINNSPSREADVIVNSADPYNMALASQASAPDKYSQYTGSITNPLASGGDVENAIDARGFGSNYDVVFSGYTNAVGAVPAKINCEITFESVIPSKAFQWESMKDGAQPFYNLSNMEIDLIIEDVFKTVFAVNGTYTAAAGGNDAFYTTQGVDAADRRVIKLKKTAEGRAEVVHQLIVHSWNPSIKLTPPRNLVYGSHDVTRPLTQSGITVNAGASQTINFNSFVLNNMPQMFCIVVRRPHLPGQPHTFLPITEVSLDMDNKSNLLKEYTPSDLYAMSTKNGLNSRYATFTGQSSSLIQTGAVSSNGSGSVLLFRASDLPLNDGVLAGSNMNLNVNGSVTVRSVSDADEVVTLEMYAIYDQVLKFDGNNFSFERPLLSKMDVVESKVKFVDNSSAINHLVGGNWASDIWGWMKRAAQSPFAKAASQFGRNNIPVVSDLVRDGTMLGNFAKSQGYGKGTKGKGKKGGQVLKLGGKQMSQRDLEALLVE